ncbi:MAG: hypothetical protein AAB632_00790 [Patescibacteria group bacterium]
MIENVIAHIQRFATFIEQNYHVNPWLFMFLFFGSALPLYFGYYTVGRSAITIEEHKIKRKKIDTVMLKRGVFIASAAWVFPYIYVVFWGKLPVKGWIAFAGFVAVMGIFFVQTLRSKVTDTKKQAE